MNKIKILCGLVLCIVALLLSAILAHNLIEKQRTIIALTPIETAVRHVMEMKEAGFKSDPDTVEAIQQVEMNDLTLVLVQYYGQQSEGDVELCEMVVETEKSLLHHWKAKNAAGLCHKVNDPYNTIPITMVSNYGNSTLLYHGYSAAYGYLRDPQITRVVVTWKDGQKQQADVQGSTFLAAREGGLSIEKIETFNNNGEIVYSSRIGSGQGDKNQ